MVGRNLDVDCKLGQGAMGAKALQAIHARIAMEVRDARADERCGHPQCVGIKVGHESHCNSNAQAIRAAPGSHRTAGNVQPARSSRLPAEGIGLDGAFVLTEKADDRRDMRRDHRVDAEEIGMGKYPQPPPFHQASKKLAARRD